MFERRLETQRLTVQSLEIHTWNKDEQYAQCHRCSQEEKQSNIAPHDQQSLDIWFSDPTPVHPGVFTKSQICSNDVELVLVRDCEVRAYCERKDDLIRD